MMVFDSITIKFLVEINNSLRALKAERKNFPKESNNFSFSNTDFSSQCK